MATTLIYEPKGRAREYSPLALNIYRGCPHECKYCYVRNKLFCKDTVPVNRAPLERIDREAAKLEAVGDKRPILLSFYSDPYPRGYRLPGTRDALTVLLRRGLNIRTLSKSGMDSTADLDVMARYPGQCEFGATLTFPNDELRKEWEPGAASHWERVEALHEAKLANIKTFVSIEPVIDADQSLEAIRTSGDAVDRYNIGWVNHRGVNPNQEALPLLIAAALKTGARVALKRDAWDVLNRIGHPEATAGCELLFDPTL